MSKRDRKTGEFGEYVRGNFLGKFPLKPLQTYLISVEIIRCYGETKTAV